MSEHSNLTMDKLRATIDQLKAQNPRAHAELMLLASLRKLSVGSLERLTDMANRGLFDSLNMFDNPAMPAAIDAARGGEVMHMELTKAQASDAIIARIKEERQLQDRKWGGPTYDDKHSLGDWAHLIEQRTATLYRAPEHKVAEQELIEVAALAIAALESLWRNREGK